MRYFIIVLQILFFHQIANSQAGIQFMGGISIAKNKNLNVTPEGKGHYGYFLGADAALNEGKMFFCVGLQYHNLSFEPTDEKQFFKSENSMSWFKLRIGLGYQLIKFSDDFILRIKTLLSINVLSSYPDDFYMAPYNNYNKGIAGGVVGIGLDFKTISLDLDYDIGLLNAVNKIEGSAFDFITLGLGVRI